MGELSELLSSEHHKETGCDLWIHFPAPGLLHTRVQGAIDLGIARQLMNGFDKVARDWNLVDAFHDWHGVSSYTSEAREEYVRWGRDDAQSGEHEPKVR